MDSNTVNAYETPKANDLYEYVDDTDDGFSSGQASSPETSPPHSSCPSSTTLPPLQRRPSALSGDGLEAGALPRRPGSSRYHILPSIGQRSCTDVKLDEAHLCASSLYEQNDLAESSVYGIGKHKPSTKCRSRMQKDAKFARQGGLSVKRKSPVNRGGKEAQRPERSSAAAEQQVVLAVKLPTGQRVEHGFQPTEKLIDVLHYVETIAQQDLTNCEFVSADRRMVLTDLNLTVASSGVPSHSVLYLHLPDDM